MMRPDRPSNPDHLSIEDWDRIGYWMFWLTAAVALFTNGAFLFNLLVFGGMWWIFRALTNR